MSQERQLDFEDFLVRQAMEREAKNLPPELPSARVQERPGIFQRLRRVLRPGAAERPAKNRDTAGL